MTLDKAYLKGANGKARRTLQNVRRALEGRRNGVVSFLGCFVSRKGIELDVRNTRPDEIEVSRKLIIGPRGGLALVTNGRRRYLKARDLGRGFK